SFHARAVDHRHLRPFPTRRSSDLQYRQVRLLMRNPCLIKLLDPKDCFSTTMSLHSVLFQIKFIKWKYRASLPLQLLLRLTNLLRAEEHTSELQSRENLVCRLLLEK